MSFFPSHPSFIMIHYYPITIYSSLYSPFTTTLPHFHVIETIRNSITLMLFAKTFRSSEPFFVITILSHHHFHHITILLHHHFPYITNFITTPFSSHCQFYHNTIFINHHFIKSPFLSHHFPSLTNFHLT